MKIALKATRLVRRAFNSRSRAWRIMTGRYRKPQKPQPQQLDMFFAAALVYSQTHKVRSRFKRRKNKRKPRGLQYVLRMSIRKTDRMVSFKNRAAPEEAANEVFTDAAARRLHYVVLGEALLSLKNHLEISSPRAAEILAWVNQEGDGDFSFENCLAIAGELSEEPGFKDPFPELDVDFRNADPDALRSQLNTLIRRFFGELPPYQELLERSIVAATGGDLDAIFWCLVPSDDVMGFDACCEALALEPDDVRAALHRRLTQPKQTALAA